VAKVPRSGLFIAGPLPFFVATQSKLSHRATQAMQLGVPAAMGASLALAVLGRSRWV
jgi:hypothetical protein